MERLGTVINRLGTTQSQDNTNHGKASQREAGLDTPIPMVGPRRVNPNCGVCQDGGFLRKVVTRPLTSKEAERLLLYPERQRDYMRRCWTEQLVELVPCQCGELQRQQRWVDYCEAESGLTAAQRERQTWATWVHALNPGCTEAYWGAKRYTEGWLLLTGNAGLGKTHLLTALTVQLAQSGRNVRYLSAPSLYESLLTAVKEDNYAAAVKGLKDQAVLVLDDLGAERRTDFAQQIFHSILDHRYHNRLPTVIATNVPNVNQFPVRLASRLTDATLVTSIKMQGEDARPRI